jgi:hypothetical protein
MSTENLEVLYTQYAEYVNDEWELGAVNELYEDGLMEIDSVDDNGTVYRLLTMDEWMERGLQTLNNQYKSAI